MTVKPLYNAHKQLYIGIKTVCVQNNLSKKAALQCSTTTKTHFNLSAAAYTCACVLYHIWVIDVISPLLPLTIAESAITQGHVLKVGIQRKLSNNLQAFRSVGISCIPLVAESLSGHTLTFESLTPWPRRTDTPNSPPHIENTKGSKSGPMNKE